MKKFIVLAFVSFLILAFGVTAYSQEKKEPTLTFKATGAIDVFGYLKKNIGDTTSTIYGPTKTADYLPGGAGYDKTDSYLFGRGNFTLNWSLDTYATGVFTFEIDSDRWGERVPNEAATGAVKTERNVAGQWDADRAAVEVKHMYIQFALPTFIPIPVPINIMAGIQPVGVDGRWLGACDGPGFTLGVRPDPVNFKIGWYKPSENKKWAADDSDLYEADVSVKISTFNVGASFMYLNANTWPWADTEPTSKARIWWAGLYADAKAGPVNLVFDFGYDNGKVEDRRDVAARYPDVKYSGWGTRLAIDFPWEKFNFGLVGIYGSGADAHKTSNSNNPIGTNTDVAGVQSSKVGAFVLLDSHGGIWGDSVIIQGAPFARGTLHYRAGPPANLFAQGEASGLWMAQLYGSAKVTPWYIVKLAAMYFGDTTKNGNTLGNAVRSDGTLRDDKAIGWEFDLYNTFQLWKGLTLDLVGGYLIAGKGLDWKETATTNDSMKDPWVIAMKFRYMF